MKTASAKAKGRKFQQKIAAAIRDTFGLQEDDIHSRPMGSQGEDLMLSPLARSKFPFSVECKKHKAFGVYSLYEQAEANAGKHTPILIIEADRSQPLAVLSFEDFLKLLKA